MASVSKSPALPYLQLISAAVLWSTGGVLIKSIDWTGPAIAGGRSLIAALVLWPFLQSKKRQIELREILAALAYAFTLYLFVLANRNTTAANSIVLQYTAPLYVALFSGIALQEPVGKRDWGFIAAALGGMLLFFCDQLSPEGWLGNVYAVVSGVCFGAMIVLMRMLKDADPLRAIVFGNLLVFLIATPSLPDYIPSLRGCGLLLVLGTFQIALPYLLFSRAIQAVRAIDGVLITTLEPILNPLWALLILGEQPGMWASIGSMIVIGSVAARAIVATQMAGAGKPRG